MSNDVTSDTEYYKSYYDRMGDASYLGEKMSTSSRMLVFCEWLRAELKPGARVLDVGCGDAIFAELMPEFEWYGVDINTDRARDRLTKGGTVLCHYKNMVCVEHDLMKPPYPWPEKYFDAIISSETLEHIWDLRVVHKEVRRLLKREGVYIISTPNFDWISNHLEHFRRIMQDRNNHWAWEHVRHYNFETHQKFLNDNGFVVEKHQGADEHYCPVAANIARVIRDDLRTRGHEISEPELGVMIGKAIPHYMHTVIIAAKKA